MNDMDDFFNVSKLKGMKRANGLHIRKGLGFSEAMKEFDTGCDHKMNKLVASFGSTFTICAIIANAPSNRKLKTL
jgi:hypothetical protein